MILFALYFWLGLSIEIDSFKGIHREWKAVILTVILQMLFVPLLGFYFSMGLDGEIREIILLLAFAPGGITSAFAARFLKLNLTLSVTLTTVTTLLNLLITQTIIAPYFISSYAQFTGNYADYVISILILFIAMLFNKRFGGFAKKMDKLMGVLVFVFIVISLLDTEKHIPHIEWNIIWILIKFHFAIVLVSAVISSLFFCIKKAPVIVLEAGFQNISLVAAMSVQMGLAEVATIPVFYGGIMFLSVLVIWLNTKVLSNAKPRLIVSRFTLPPYNAQVIPPFGILISPSVLNNYTILKHELIHWSQYKELGLMGFYLRYFRELIQFGYDKSRMEIEARIMSGENIENLEEYSKNVNKKKPMK